MENIRAQSWYNGDQPRYLNGFLNDKSNRLIGWATMRQLRVKSISCSDQRLISQCSRDYNLFNEEKQSFQPGWTNQTNDEQYSSAIVKSFEYQRSEKLDTSFTIGEHAIYSGNGYVYEYHGSLMNLRGNLSQLHRLGWIDERTRAVFIQMTLYNPNVQLFTAVTMVAEFLSSGGVFTSARFEPMNFFGRIKIVLFLVVNKKIVLVFNSLIQLICTVIYMGLVVCLMVQQVRLLRKMKWKKYLREFWSYIDMGIIACSWGMVMVYVWRFRESNRISQIFAQTNGFVYVNLQGAVYVNDLLTYFQGFCCFFGIIKLARLCRLNSRLSLFTQTLSNATKELLSFLFMFCIVFMSFISLFYLLFVSKMWSCSSMLSTAQMLFEVTLMKFDTADLLNADTVLGPVCFSIFVLITVFVCLSILVTIIMENFRRAREQRSREEEMLSYMWKKFLRWTGTNLLN